MISEETKLKVADLNVRIGIAYLLMLIVLALFLLVYALAR